MSQSWDILGEGLATKLKDIRKGRRYLTENEALYLADEVGADKEIVLVYLAADKAKSYEAQTLWNNIAKKFNGLNLHSISIACVGLAMWIGSPSEAIAQYALCVLMLSAISITAIDRFVNSLTFERVNHEVSRND